MNIEETFTLDAPVAQVYDFLGDVHRVAGCVPGVGDITQREDGAYEATLEIQMGPIRAAFAGEVSLTTTTDPYRIEAAGRGKDRKSGSRAEIAFAGDLEPDGDTATRVTTSADVTIRGRLGQFGTGVIRATATEVLRDFVACANGVLREEAAASATPGAAGDSASADGAAHRSARTNRISLGLVLRILASFIRNTFSAIVTRLRRMGR